MEWREVKHKNWCLIHNGLVLAVVNADFGQVPTWYSSVLLPSSVGKRWKENKGRDLEAVKQQTQAIADNALRKLTTPPKATP